MRRLRMPLSFIACLGLLALQLSGLHMHVDDHGYVGVPVGGHVHGTVGHSDQHGAAHHDDADHDGDHHDDYSGDLDVSVVKLGVASKLVLWFVWIALGLVLVHQASAPIRWNPDTPRPKAHRDRWRPPLRAPPFSPSH